MFKLLTYNLIFNAVILRRDCKFLFLNALPYNLHRNLYFICNLAIAIFIIGIVLKLPLVCLHFPFILMKDLVSIFIIELQNLN
jgi:hypothetical protein